MPGSFRSFEDYCEMPILIPAPADVRETLDWLLVGCWDSVAYSLCDSEGIEDSFMLNVARY